MRVSSGQRPRRTRCQLPIAGMGPRRFHVRLRRIADVVEEDRRGKIRTVDRSEHAAVAPEDRALILDAEVALTGRSGDVGRNPNGGQHAPDECAFDRRKGVNQGFRNAARSGS